VGTKLVPRAVPTPGRYPRPDLPVGLDAGIGRTARPRPIADADSPIEAATPDPQRPLCYLYYSSHGGLTSHHSSTPGQLPDSDRPVGLGRRADAGIGRTALPLPIAVADSPIEAATPDPHCQRPMSRTRTDSLARCYSGLPVSESLARC
jgi:hypothetical protein